ncbi:hypothetical protein ITJ57_01830 [Plantibacter sp. VKM Ac-2880]|uniref:DUF7882 family protein n=1 Tax=Plantibacter sp. VKM Ac-2880 TaxID=2783827 RepID=UPI0018906DED|nr:hypothetical protein [Plantibacter sp. VKM Ac-2880]MBF4567491.1 hypothetical protein [Plantibacter sp. VKM Ac-2880]
MGTLVYGISSAQVQIADPELAHVKAIALLKLRRNESFALMIRFDGCDSGRTTLWLHPAIPLQFRFESDERSEMDRKLLEALMQKANAGELTINASSPAPL